VADYVKCAKDDSEKKDKGYEELTVVCDKADDEDCKEHC